MLNCPLSIVNCQFPNVFSIYSRLKVIVSRNLIFFIHAPSSTLASDGAIFFASTRHNTNRAIELSIFGGQSISWAYFDFAHHMVYKLLYQTKFFYCW